MVSKSVCALAAILIVLLVFYFIKNRKSKVEAEAVVSLDDKIAQAKLKLESVQDSLEQAHFLDHIFRLILLKRTSVNFKSKTYDELVNSHFLKFFLNVSQLSNVKEFYSKLEFALYSGKKLGYEL